MHLVLQDDTMLLVLRMQQGMSVRRYGSTCTCFLFYLLSWMSREAVRRV